MGKKIAIGAALIFGVYVAYRYFTSGNVSQDSSGDLVKDWFKLSEAERSAIRAAAALDGPDGLVGNPSARSRGYTKLERVNPRLITGGIAEVVTGPIATPASNSPSVPAPGPAVIADSIPTAPLPPCRTLQDAIRNAASGGRYCS